MSDNTPTPSSNPGSKRPSPPTSGVFQAPKRFRPDGTVDLSDGSGVNTPMGHSYGMGSGAATSGTSSVAGGAGAGAGTGAGGAPPAPSMDPDQLSDALLSAGVDLKEEENLLSSSLSIADASRQHAGMYGAGPDASAAYGRYVSPATEFLNAQILRQLVRKSASDEGVRYLSEKDSEIVRFLSVACQEWLSDIITNAVVLNRHRRRSRNDVHSDISRALRNIAIKDKEREERRLAERALQESAREAGGDGSEKGAKKSAAVNEETQYRAANATAAMMTGKKKYSWLTGGAGASPGAGAPRPGAGRSDSGINYREAREEPQLALRDLLGALEERRFGVEGALVKGYAKLRN
uniref:Transcription initiation factor TFIID subunit 4 n=1 Tax=Blastobotrys adeninivorans TaxID=409370 RepID=A0A060T0M6_BLAAD